MSAPTGRGADDTRRPAETGAYEESILFGQIFQDFRKLCFEAVRYQASRLFEQFVKRGSLEGEHAKVGKDLLLPKPES